MLVLSTSILLSLVVLQAQATGRLAVLTFLEAHAVAEFTQCFSQLIPGIPPLSLAEVQHAVCWPLEVEGRLAALYCGLLRMLLSSWVGVLMSQQDKQTGWAG